MGFIILKKRKKGSKEANWTRKRGSYHF